MEHVYLSRRNLLTLLSKLDRRTNGEDTLCAIVKNDNKNNKYPQSMNSIIVTAVEDKDYYNDRGPGEVCPADEPNL